VSSIAANAATAPPPGEGAADNLRLRILSALVLAPVTIAALVWSASAFAVLIGLAGLVMSWEWDRLRSRTFGPAGWLGALTVVIAGGFALGGFLTVAVLVIFGAAVAGYYVIRFTDRRDAELAALGIVVAAAVPSALIWLRSLPEGLVLAGWLIGVVWATDIGAYVAGKALRGPRLAPRLSAGKTWAGLAGGIVLAAAWGGALGAIWTGGAGRSAAAAAFGAVLAQTGDLVISAVKRHYDAKDSSQIIPGHGGVLDRVAGFVITAPVMASMVAMGSFAPWR
jgi:phosphatidate cytidylyltransferase